MKRWLSACAFVLCLSVTTTVSANQGLDACSDLPPPFSDLMWFVLEPTVPSPPQVQLCHRIANASKHYDADRDIKAIDELEKFIREVEQSTPHHLPETLAQDLIAEAEHVILIISGEPIPSGQVAGGVFYFGSELPAPGASITLLFPSSGAIYGTTADSNGLFSLEDLTAEGAFVLTAEDGAGATGSAQGSLLETDLEASVLVLIDQPGTGSISGNVEFEDATPAASVLVTALFPETERTVTTVTDANGNYALGGLALDGTVIVIAFDSATAASASASDVVSVSMPSAAIDLTLQTPPLVNPELTNTGFTDGFNGWYTSGPVEIVDRDLVFDLQDN